MAGTWGLSEASSEANAGFLLNHLISETLPAHPGEASLTNSDPITGQAAWYDLKVRVRKDPDQTPPQGAAQAGSLAQPSGAAS
jgi:hypothetical protein